MLTVATKLQCDGIRTLALSKIKTLAPAVDRLIVGRQHKHREILLSGYADLINRFDPLNEEELEKLCMPEIALITARRERRIMDAMPPYAHSLGVPPVSIEQVEASCWAWLPPKDE